MISNFAFDGVGVAGMACTFRAPVSGHPVIPARAAAAAPRKRRAAAQTIAASVGGFS